MWVACNENVLDLIACLKNARQSSLGQLWAMCDEAVEILEELMQYEANHGLREFPQKDNDAIQV